MGILKATGLLLLAAGIGCRSYGDDRPLPTREALLRRLINTRDEDIDLIEAATVLAQRPGFNPRYSSIPRFIEPYLVEVKARLGPQSTDEDKTRALNEIVLPAITQA